MNPNNTMQSDPVQADSQANAVPQANTASASDAPQQPAPASKMGGTTSVMAEVGAATATVGMAASTVNSLKSEIDTSSTLANASAGVSKAASLFKGLFGKK